MSTGKKLYSITCLCIKFEKLEKKHIKLKLVLAEKRE